jgi:hypothetical protein
MGVSPGEMGVSPGEMGVSPGGVGVSPGGVGVSPATLKGRLVVSGGLGGMGGAQPLAATFNGAAFLGADVDRQRIEIDCLVAPSSRTIQVARGKAGGDRREALRRGCRCDDGGNDRRGV